MLDVCLLGRFEVRTDGALVDIPSRPVQSLLAYLILNARKSYRRENLAWVLWPDSSERNARNNLRQALWRLRKAMGETYFVADKISIRFNAAADYRLDVDTLQSGGGDNPTLEDLIASVSVYEDRLLPGFYDEWILLEQERLQSLYEDRMQRLSRGLVAQARWREAIQWADHWIAHGAMSEQPYRTLMKAHAGLGDHAGMTLALRRCTDTLRKELGIDPSRETRQLFQRLASGETGPLPVKGQMSPGNAIPTVNLPLQPTPFVGRTQEMLLISNLLADPAKRLVTINGPGGMGKTRLAIEAARRQAGLFSNGVYFIPLAPLEDPVFMVSLIAETVNFSFHVRDQREQWEADRQIQQLSGFLKEKNILFVLDNVEHLLTASLPIMADWKKGAEALVSDILGSAPQIKILATSRERLNLQGETLVGLDGLGFPRQKDDTAGAETFSAVRLFVRSAGLVHPGFTLDADNMAGVIDICRLVEGMPLAIQLAAAWVDLLSPGEIASEIRAGLEILETTLLDVPPRQQSIRSIFTSTWQRLTRTEQNAFQQLVIFRGGFTRQAAQTVTGTPLPVLRSLKDKSLVRPDFRGRYQIHELLRQFGSEQLGQSPETEAEARHRHCNYFAGFLSARESDLSGRSQGKALAEIEVEIDNVRAAWNWAVAHGKYEQLEQMMESLCEFYRIRGELNEGFETFHPTAIALGWQGVPDSRAIPPPMQVFDETMQILAESRPETRDRKKALLGKVLARYVRFHCESPSGAWNAYQIRQSALRTLSGTGAAQEVAWVLRYMGHIGLRPREIHVLYQKALAIFKDAGDRRGTADILFRLGLTARQMGEYRQAQQLYEKSLAKSRHLDSRQTIMFCLAEQAWIQWALGNYPLAEALCNESLPLSEEIGYPSFRAIILRYLSRIALSRQNHETAKAHLQESLDIYKRLGLRGMMAEVLAEKARISVTGNDLAGACRLARESLEICEERTHHMGMVEPLTVLGEASLENNDLFVARAHLHKAVQTAADACMPPFALHALAGMARLLAAEEKTEQALAFAAFVSRHPAAWQWSRDCAAPVLDELETALSPETAAAIRKRVESKPLDALIRELGDPTG